MHSDFFDISRDFRPEVEQSEVESIVCRLAFLLDMKFHLKLRKSTSSFPVVLAESSSCPLVFQGHNDAAFLFCNLPLILQTPHSLVLFNCYEFASRIAEQSCLNA